MPDNSITETLDTLKLIYGEDKILEDESVIVFKDSSEKLGFVSKITGKVVECQYDSVRITPEVVLCGHSSFDAQKRSLGILQSVEVYSLVDDKHFVIPDTGPITVIKLPKTSKLIIISSIENIHIFSTEQFKIVKSLDMKKYKVDSDINYWGEPEYVCIVYKENNTLCGVLEDGTVGTVHDILKLKYPDIEVIKPGKNQRYRVKTKEGTIEELGSNGFRY